MPIIKVEIYTKNQNFFREKLNELADNLGEIFNSGPRETWVTLIFYDPLFYSENSSTKINELPLFLNILKKKVHQNMDQKQMEINRITEITSKLFNYRYENVHVIYEAPAINRVWFGGNLVTS